MLTDLYFGFEEICTKTKLFFDGEIGSVDSIDEIK